MTLCLHRVLKTKSYERMDLQKKKIPISNT
jgi:hypothetical protein